MKDYCGLNTDIFIQLEYKHYKLLVYSKCLKMLKRKQPRVLQLKWKWEKKNNDHLTFTLLCFLMKNGNFLNVFPIENLYCTVAVRSVHSAHKLWVHNHIKTKYCTPNAITNALVFKMYAICIKSQNQKTFRYILVHFLSVIQICASSIRDVCCSFWC